MRNKEVVKKKDPLTKPVVEDYSKEKVIPDDIISRLKSSQVGVVKLSRDIIGSSEVPFDTVCKLLDLTFVSVISLDYNEGLFKSIRTGCCCGLFLRQKKENLQAKFFKKIAESPHIKKVSLVLCGQKSKKRDLQHVLCCLDQSSLNKFSFSFADSRVWCKLNKKDQGDFFEALQYLANEKGMDISFEAKGFKLGAPVSGEDNSFIAGICENRMLEGSLFNKSLRCGDASK